MSSMYRACPVTLSRPSLGGEGNPTIRSLFTPDEAPMVLKTGWIARSVASLPATGLDRRVAGGGDLGCQYCERKPNEFTGAIDVSSSRHGPSLTIRSELYPPAARPKLAPVNLPFANTRW